MLSMHDAKPGEPVCGVSLYRRFVSAAQRAGLPVLRFHDLRHSFGTQAIRAFNIYEVQRMMGHRHITTTGRRSAGCGVSPVGGPNRLSSPETARFQVRNRHNARERRRIPALSC